MTDNKFHIGGVFRQFCFTNGLLCVLYASRREVSVRTGIEKNHLDNICYQCGEHIGDKSITSLIRHPGDSPNMVGIKIDRALQNTLDVHDCLSTI